MGIDLFSLYILFSHFRPRDATRGNSFFQMLSYERANLRITNEKTKGKIPMRASRGLKWENKMYKLKRSIVQLVNVKPILVSDATVVIKRDTTKCASVTRLKRNKSLASGWIALVYSNFQDGLRWR